MSEPQHPGHPVTVQDALVAVMIATCISDERHQTSELLAISQLIDHLPVFAEYPENRIREVTSFVTDLFGIEDGLTVFFQAIRDVLPSRFTDTAYALACDVAASDHRLRQIELRFLQEVRHELDIDRLTAAAIERSAGARYRH